MTRLAATRAVSHWAWRMFRRDWRSQFLVLTLLTIVVAVSSYGAALGHALAPSDQASFGSASARVQFSASDPAQASATIEQARQRLGPLQQITDTFVPVPGSVRQLDLRTQAGPGRFQAGNLRLRSGHYPLSNAEVALTADLSRLLGAPVGSTVTLPGAGSRRVVGLVENPSRLSDSFGLVTSPPTGRLVRYTLLVKASAASLAGFHAAVTMPGGIQLDTPTYYSHDLGVLLVAALGMILVAVVALTAFLVLAQRRVRQLGMLAAVGATRRQVRNVTVTHGLIVGAIAAVMGTAAAGVGWQLTNTVIVQVSGRRADWAAVPLWLILTPGLMGMVAATVAAWWPGRAMARVPVVRALSNRPLEAPTGHRPAAAAAAAFGLGAVCLHFGHQRNALLMISGLAAMIAAVLLTTPLAVRAVTGHIGWLPITARLAGRELGRNQSRSAAALATVTIAVGISVAAVVITAANAHPASAGNLSDRQLLIPLTGGRDGLLVPPRTAGQTAALDGAAARVAATVPASTLVPLNLVTDPAANPTSQARASGQLDAVQVVRQVGDQLRSWPLYQASPALLAALGGTGGHDFYTLHAGGSWTQASAQREAIATPAPLAGHAFTSLPQVLAAPAAVASHHWRAIRAGWLVESARPLTSGQLDAARTEAAKLGLVTETRDPQAYLGRWRVMFTLGGILVTVAVIAIALVLLRVQTTRDQQILTAVGAPRRARRAIAAAIATQLAALGTVLGIGGAYLTLILAYGDTLDRLRNVPWSALTSIVLGVPALTLATAWLSAGRGPTAIGRPAME